MMIDCALSLLIGVTMGDAVISATVLPMTAALVAPMSTLQEAFDSQQLDQLIQMVDREKKEGRGRKATATFVRGLTHQDAKFRWLSARMLARLGGDAEEAIPALSRSIHDPDNMVRWSSGDALREIVPQSAKGLDVLIAALSDEDELVRWSAIQAVAKVGPRARRAAPILVEMLSDNSLVVRREAARTLRSVFPHIPAVSLSRP
jgi:HEAT repeat protein